MEIKLEKVAIAKKERIIATQIKRVELTHNFGYLIIL